MSFAQTYNAFQTIDLTAGQKLVLAGIATFAGSTGKAWPAISTIAKRCSMGVRTVQRHIAKLVSLGYLERVYRSGKAAITRVRLDVATPAKLAPLPLPNWHPESAIESVNQITAHRPDQGTDPTADTADAAVVIFDSVKARGQETAPEMAGQGPVESADQGPVESLTIELVPFTVTPDIDQGPVEVADQGPVEVAGIVMDPDPLAAVPADLLEDFAVVRRAKKKAAKVTRLEGQVLASEAAKARMTVEDVVKLCILRGWSRFEAVFATPNVMAQFNAAMMPAQSPQTTPQRFYVPEVVQPASPSVKAAAMAAIAVLRAKIKAQPFERMKARSPG